MTKSWQLRLCDPNSSSYLLEFLQHLAVKPCFVMASWPFMNPWIYCIWYVCFIPSMSIIKTINKPSRLCLTVFLMYCSFLFTPQTSDYLRDVCSVTYIFAKWMWCVLSNSCTYQDRGLCSPTRRRRCTSSRWTFGSTVLKIGAPSGDLLDVVQQSLTLKTCHTQQRISFSRLLWSSRRLAVHPLTVRSHFAFCLGDLSIKTQRNKGCGQRVKMTSASQRKSLKRKSEKHGKKKFISEKNIRLELILQQESSIFDVRSAILFCLGGSLSHCCFLSRVFAKFVIY